MYCWFGLNWANWLKPIPSPGVVWPSVWDFDSSFPQLYFPFGVSMLGVFEAWGWGIEGLGVYVADWTLTGGLEGVGVFLSAADCTVLSEGVYYFFFPASFLLILVS